jgi:hypothetical protein
LDRQETRDAVTGEIIPKAMKEKEQIVPYDVPFL